MHWEPYISPSLLIQVVYLFLLLKADFHYWFQVGNISQIDLYNGYRKMISSYLGASVFKIYQHQPPLCNLSTSLPNELHEQGPTHISTCIYKKLQFMQMVPFGFVVQNMFPGLRTYQTKISASQFQEVISLPSCLRDSVPCPVFPSIFTEQQLKWKSVHIHLCIHAFPTCYAHFEIAALPRVMDVPNINEEEPGWMPCLHALGAIGYVEHACFYKGSGMDSCHVSMHGERRHKEAMSKTLHKLADSPHRFAAWHSADTWRIHWVSCLHNNMKWTHHFLLHPQYLPAFSVRLLNTSLGLGR